MRIEKVVKVPDKRLPRGRECAEALASLTRQVDDGRLYDRDLRVVADAAVALNNALHRRLARHDRPAATTDQHHREGILQAMTAAHLHELVDQLNDAQADVVRAVVLQLVTTEAGTDHAEGTAEPGPRALALVGAGAAGTGITNRIDELLAEGFGRD